MTTTTLRQSLVSNQSAPLRQCDNILVDHPPAHVTEHNPIVLIDDPILYPPPPGCDAARWARLEHYRASANDQLEWQFEALSADGRQADVVAIVIAIASGRWQPRIARNPVQTLRGALNRLRRQLAEDGVTIEARRRGTACTVSVNRPTAKRALGRRAA
jgi:hypothetical protein